MNPDGAQSQADAASNALISAGSGCGALAAAKRARTNLDAVANGGMDAVWL